MSTIRVKLYSNIIDKALGLIGHTKPEPVIFKTRFGIHTFGMQFPIDVVILDQAGRVERLKENLVPGRIFLWPIKYNKVLELPAGFIVKKRIRIGSKIKLEWKN